MLILYHLNANACTRTYINVNLFIAPVKRPCTGLNKHRTCNDN